MSTIAYNLACRCNLRPPTKAVLKEMGWFADDAGENIWPSVQTLAERTGLTRRAVQELLRELEKAGAIQALGSRLGGRHRTTHYRMDFGWLKENAQTANRVRPFPPQDTCENRNSEPRDDERANGNTENSEPSSPEHKEHEYEQGKKPLSLKTERRSATSYEYQRLEQKVRKSSLYKSMPSQLSKEQLAKRKIDLQRQAEEVARRFGYGGNTS